MTVVCSTNEGLYGRCRGVLGSGRMGFDYVQTDTGLLSSFKASLDTGELTAAASRGGFFSYVAGIYMS
jgi:hypothetical protein